MATDPFRLELSFLLCLVSLCLLSPGCGKADSGQPQLVAPVNVQTLEGLRVDSGHSGELTLRYRFTPGSRWDYRMDTQIRMRMSGAGEPFETISRQSLQYTQSVIENTAEGAVVESAVKTVRLEFQPDVGDLKTKIEELMVGFSARQKVDPRGAAVQALEPEVLHPELRPFISLFKDVINQRLPTLPQQPVKPGDSWSSNRVATTMLMAGGQMETRATNRSRLAGFARYQGHECSVLDTDVELSVSGNVSRAEGAGSSTGTGRGRIRTLFDWREGRIIALSMTLHLENTLAGKGESLTQRIELKAFVEAIR